MNIGTKVSKALIQEEFAYYEAEAKKLKTDAIHEALMDEAHRRGFFSVVTDRVVRPLAAGNLPLSDEELTIGLCRSAALGSPRSLILAFQIIARGKVEWSRLASLGREHGVAPVLKWLATRTITPRTAALLFQLRGESVAEINIHADRFRKPYLSPLYK